MTAAPTVCAVIVTHNRKELLRECLRAVRGQTLPPVGVLVIDNASSDGTDEMLRDELAAAHPVRVEVVRLPTNGGGAGGFHEGIRLASESGADWLWLMDDDTIARPTAVQEAFAAYARFPADQKPRVLASKVEWTDGTAHWMNLPTLKKTHSDPDRALTAIELGTASIRWASFVSVFVERSLVAQYGLPFADYFIWNDDTEYTARILRHEFGVVVPASVVVHKTARKHSPMDASPQRSYYQVRNVLWMIFRSTAWPRDDKLKIGIVHLQWIMTYLRRARFKWSSVRPVLNGIIDGLLRQPRR
jgi:GT2 family glycosyltransferase